MAKNDDMNLVYRAEIEALVLAATIAIKTRDSDAFTDASRQLEAMAEDMAIPSEIRDVASDVHDSLALAMTDAALDAMRNRIQQVSGAVATLQKALDTAKAARAGLFLPKLADAASQAFTKFKDVKDAVDNVGKDLRTVTSGELGDLPEKLDGLLADLKRLQDATRTS